LIICIAGAHGRFVEVTSGKRVHSVQTALPNTWLSRVNASGTGCREAKPISQDQQLTELLVISLLANAVFFFCVNSIFNASKALGLRMTAGVSEQRWLQQSGGVSFAAYFATVPAFQFAYLLYSFHLSAADCFTSPEYSWNANYLSSMLTGCEQVRLV
jgi:hypothetical protein